MHDKIVRYVLFSIFVVFSFRASGQYVVQGRIFDGSQHPVSFASVGLMNVKDSSFVSGVISEEDGSFVIRYTRPGHFYIIITFIGFDDFRSREFVLSTSAPLVDLGVLQVQEKVSLLDAVTVRAEKPVVELTSDRLIFNVENSILSEGSTALEVLERAPGVSVDQDGLISVKGREGVRVMINGRLSYLSQTELTTLLKGTPSGNISKIEVITNPSARYDAAGTSGMINIIFKENNLDGINGSAFMNAGKGRNGRFNAGGNLNYRTGKLNLYGNYSNSVRGNTELRDDIRKFRNESGALGRISAQNTSDLADVVSHDFQGGLDYYLKENTVLGILVNGNIGKRDSDINTENRLSGVDGQAIYIATTDNSESAKWNSMSYNLNFSHEFSKSGVGITADLNYSGNSFKASQYMHTNYDSEANLSASSRRGSIPSLTDILVGKVDYTYPLGEKGKLESGWKSSSVKVNNNLGYDTLRVDRWVLDASTSNHFIYRENIHAGYLNYQNEWGQFSLMAGLRGEYTGTVGNQVTTDSIVRRNYFQLFPSAFSTYKFDDNHSLQLTYSRRIGRPNYDDLNPFRVYRDPYQYYGGNPFVKPELGHSLEFSYSFQSKLVATLNYAGTSNAIIGVLEQIDSLNTTRSAPQNIKSKQNLGLSIMASFNMTAWWSVNSFVSVFNNRFTGGEQISLSGFNNSRTSFIGSMHNDFRLPVGIKAEISANYTSSTVYSVYRNKSVYVVSAGASRQVLNNRATLKVAVNDIFQSRQRRNSAQLDDLNFQGRVRFDSRAATVSFSYRFGGKVKAQRDRASGLDDIQDRVKK